MTYRDIPLVLFNSIIKEGTLRPYEPDSHRYVISQVACLQRSRAGALYQFNDIQPEHAIASLIIYYGNPAVVKPREPSFSIYVGMTEFEATEDKGRLFRAELHVNCAIDLVKAPYEFTLTVSRLISRAVTLQKRAVREMFWEYELYPRRRNRTSAEQ